MSVFSGVFRNRVHTLTVTQRILLEGGTAAAPSLAWGRDSGFYESVNDTIAVAIGGNVRWSFSATQLGSPQSGGGQLLQSGTSDIVPYVRNAGDVNTGIGSAGPDALSLIAGGVEGARITEAQRTIETNATVAETDGGDLRMVTTAAHALSVNDVVQFAAGTGSLPTGITAATNYYVTQVDDANKFNLSTSRGGSNVSYTDTGTAFNSYQMVITANIYGSLHLPEITTPTAVPNYGSIYPKSDNDLYFQDGAGVEHLIGHRQDADGEMYIASTQTQSIASSATWYEVGTFTAGDLDGITFASDRLTAPEAGEYLVTWSVSTSSASANKTFSVGIGVNGSDPTTKAIIQRRFSSSDVGAMSGQALISLTAGQYVNLMVRGDTDTTNIDFNFGNFQLERI